MKNITNTRFFLILSLIISLLLVDFLKTSSNEQIFSFIKKPIPLVSPDDKNSGKLRVHTEGLNFLLSLKQSGKKLAVISVVGRAKTGKSFLLNRMLGLKHVQSTTKKRREMIHSASKKGSDINPFMFSFEFEDFEEGGFPVGVDVFPETKGILLWGEPFNLTKTSTIIDPKTNQPKEIAEEYYLIFMDTEGLGAPGNFADSYDPKLCALSIITSSVFVYNLNLEIQMKDIQLLHHVVTLNQVFEQKMHRHFPFPPVLWLVQHFSHGLDGHTGEEYLDWALEEKENPKNSEEIKKYNETVAVVKKYFPTLGGTAPRIILLQRPHPSALMHKLPQIPESELDPKYLEQVSFIKSLILSYVSPKTFSDGLDDVDGETLANLIQNLVEQMNQINSSDVGFAFIKELAKTLSKRCFSMYLNELILNENFALPQDPLFLTEKHKEIKKQILEIFKKEITGGLTSFENKKQLLNLENEIELAFERHISNNTLVTKVVCQENLSQKKAIFENKMFDDVLDFERQIIQLKKEFIETDKICRGANNVKSGVFDIFANSFVKTKRDLILSENSRDDLIQMMAFFFGLFFCSLLLSKLIQLIFSENSKSKAFFEENENRSKKTKNASFFTILLKIIYITMNSKKQQQFLEYFSLISIFACFLVLASYLHLVGVHQFLSFSQIQSIFNFFKFKAFNFPGKSLILTTLFLGIVLAFMTTIVLMFENFDNVSETKKPEKKKIQEKKEEAKDEETSNSKVNQERPFQKRVISETLEKNSTNSPNFDFYSHQKSQSMSSNPQQPFQSFQFSTTTFPPHSFVTTTAQPTAFVVQQPIPAFVFGATTSQNQNQIPNNNNIFPSNYGGNSNFSKRFEKRHDELNFDELDTSGNESFDNGSSNNNNNEHITTRRNYATNDKKILKKK